jgi:deoxyribonuclease-4
MIFGAHCSTAGGVRTALSRAERIGAECVQIFVKNNMQWLGKPPGPEEAAGFAADRARGGFKAVFGHAGYLINLGGPPSPNRDRSLQSLIQEISFAGALGLPFLVLHPGAHLGAGEERGLELIVAGLDEALSKTNKSGVRLALENTAGQGTCLGHKIEHLAAIFEAVRQPERLGLCLDTAHFFAAGFDLRTGKGWDAALAKVDRLIGRKEILAFHLNDSKTGLGSRVDRHEHIGKGKIGLAGFRHIVNDARFLQSPGCLETPKSDDLREDMENLATLRALVEYSRKMVMSY